jgi:hypothetical protein
MIDEQHRFLHITGRINELHGMIWLEHILVYICGLFDKAFTQTVHPAIR